MVIKALLFDFDGVLAETMEDLFLAWKDAFLHYGIKIDRKDYFPLEGTKVLEIAKIISYKFNKKTDPDDIVRLKDEFYLKNHSFKLYPGVIELIKKLKNKKIKLSIVSASTRYKFEKSVPNDFLDLFDFIISGDDYKNGKPNPEPYLTAVNKLNMKKEECIVIENAPLGIKSAKNAGIFCIAIESTLPRENLIEADIIVDKFKDLENLEIIKNLGEGTKEYIACGLFINDKKEILLLLRDNKPNIIDPNTWGLIGGHLEKGEKFLEALKREVKEEINYDIDTQPILIGKICNHIIETARIYKIKINKKIEDLVLTEGQMLCYYSFDEIIKNPNVVPVLKKFLLKNKKVILED